MRLAVDLNQEEPTSGAPPRMGPRPLPSWDGIGVVHHGKSDTAMTAWGQKGHLDRRLAVSGLPRQADRLFSCPPRLRIQIRATLGYRERMPADGGTRESLRARRMKADTSAIPHVWKLPSECRGPLSPAAQCGYRSSSRSPRVIMRPT